MTDENYVFCCTYNLQVGALHGYFTLEVCVVLGNQRCIAIS